MINIRGLDKKKDEDIFYRYKMHKPILTDQKNNKIFDNIDLICKEINRDKKDLVKFIKSKNGINIVNKNNKTIFPKNITVDQILETLYEFIEKDVLCPKCRLPETNIIDKCMHCKCCSYSGKL